MKEEGRRRRGGGDGRSSLLDTQEIVML